jgi:glycosyltransferase involved in cell wall biosynthesis
VTGSDQRTGTAPGACQGEPPDDAQPQAAPLVTFIIPTHNYGRFLPEAINSALAQTYPNFELIVVDDGSTDNTPELVAPLQGRLRYIRQEQSGPSAARNAGIRVAGGELIAFLDADDIWLPRKTAAQARFLLEHPEIGLVCGLTRSTGDQERNQPGNRRRSGRARRKLITLKAGVAFDDLFLSHRNYIATSTVMLRRQCLDLVGHFEESLSRVEDWNLWLRVARHFGIARLPEVVALHRFHTSNLALDRETMRQAVFDNLGRICSLFPDAARWRQLVASRLYVKHGLQDIYQGRLQDARRNLRRAIRDRALNVTAYPLLLAACLPQAMLEAARTASRVARHCLWAPQRAIARRIPWATHGSSLEPHKGQPAPRR